MACLEECGTK